MAELNSTLVKGNLRVTSDVNVSGKVGLSTNGLNIPKKSDTNPSFTDGDITRTSTGALCLGVGSGSAEQIAFMSAVNAKLDKSGGTMTGDITLSTQTSVKQTNPYSSSWVNGRQNALVKTTSYTGYNPILSMKTTNGSWDFGVYNDNICHLSYITDTNFNASTNQQTYDIIFPKKGGTIAVTSDIPNVSGKLDKSGGTMTGNLTLLGDQYSRQGALNCNNSDIIGVNSIYTQDTADNTAEGIRFYRDSSHWDSFTISGGVMYFKANDGNDGTAFSNANVVLHSGNCSTYTGVSLAADSGNAAVTLAAGSKYKLTAGGTSVIFQMPSDNNTDTYVKQEATVAANYRPVLLGYTSNSNTAQLAGTVTNQSYVTTSIYAKPSTGELHATELYEGSTRVLTPSRLTSTHVTTALGYTPYNSTNPSGFITASYIDSIIGVDIAAASHDHSRIGYSTSNPSAAAASGYLQFCVLSQSAYNSATKRDRTIYFIT